MNEGIEQQVEQYRQQSAQSGFSGSAIVDINPGSGIIRLKIKTIPPESIQQFITNYINIIVMSLNTVNINVKIHVTEEEKHD
jgi:uncharacterized protein (DUF2252 family)